VRQAIGHHLGSDILGMRDICQDPKGNDREGNAGLQCSSSRVTVDVGRIYLEVNIERPGLIYEQLNAKMCQCSARSSMSFRKSDPLGAKIRWCIGEVVASRGEDSRPQERGKLGISKL